LDLLYNKETWEKFHQLKSMVDTKKGTYHAYADLIRDVKFAMYFGGAAQVI